MGNCVFKTGSRLLYYKEDVLIRVVTPTGGVMELRPPILAEFVTTEFPGHAIYPTRDRDSCPPLLHHEELFPGNIYYLLPLSTSAAAANHQVPLGQTTPYRMSFGSKAPKTTASRAESTVGHGGGTWKVRLVISPEQLAEILGQEEKTEALIESVRTVAKCGNYGEANSVASSDQWSVTSSWKGHSRRSTHEYE